MCKERLCYSKVEILATTFECVKKDYVALWMASTLMRKPLLFCHSNYFLSTVVECTLGELVTLLNSYKTAPRSRLDSRGYCFDL